LCEQSGMKSFQCSLRGFICRG